MREYLNRSREQWALIRTPNAAPNTSLAMFVHGFRGNYLATWGKIPELIAEHADQDPILAGWDFLFVGYATREEYEIQFSDIFDQVVAFAAGSPINVVNPGALGKRG